MSRFIKLTNMILNTNDIHKILIGPTNYHILLNNRNIEGSVWLIAGTGLGKVSTPYTPYITICQKNNPEDYKSIWRWIQNIDKVE